MSKVLEGEAESLAREVGRDILREAIRARLKERIGARLEALGRMVADRLVEDLEANLEIEALVARRRDARRAEDARIAAALGHRPEASSPPGHDPQAPGGEGGQR